MCFCAIMNSITGQRMIDFWLIKNMNEIGACETISLFGNNNLIRLGTSPIKRFARKCRAFPLLVCCHAWSSGHQLPCQPQLECHPCAVAPHPLVWAHEGDTWVHRLVFGSWCHTSAGSTKPDAVPADGLLKLSSGFGRSRADATSWHKALGWWMCADGGGTRRCRCSWWCWQWGAVGTAGNMDGEGRKSISAAWWWQAPSVKYSSTEPCQCLQQSGLSQAGCLLVTRSDTTPPPCVTPIFPSPSWGCAHQKVRSIFVSFLSLPVSPAQLS